MVDLFGPSETPVATPIEASRRKRRAPEVARGYYAEPGTGPAGETCGSCAHAVPIRTRRTYWKCLRVRSKWTRGRGTDILVGSPACAGWAAAAAPGRLGGEVLA